MKPSDFRNYSEYMGGLGDVILRLNTSPWYADLENLPNHERAAVVLMSHNPAVSELWKWHPKASRIHLFDFGMSPSFHPWESLEWRRQHDLPDQSPCPPPYDGPMKFYPSTEDAPHLESLASGGPYAIFSPVAGTSERTIPVELQSSILRALMEHGIRPVSVGLSRYGRPIQSPGMVNLVDKLSVPGTIEAIRSASVVVACHSSVAMMTWFLKKHLFLLYPKWVRETYERCGPFGYFFGAKFPTTNHMEFVDYRKERIDELLGKALKGA